MVRAKGMLQCATVSTKQKRLQ